MKTTKSNLKKIIKNLLNEARLSKSERELIRLQVELELGEEFELLAAQAKDLEDYDRLHQMFLRHVEEETQKRIAAKEAGMTEPPVQPLKVKINRGGYMTADKGDRASWESQFQPTTKKEIVPVSSRPYHPGKGKNMSALPGPTNHPSIEKIPDEDDGNTIDVTNMSMNLSRRDLLKNMLAGAAIAGTAGVFDPIISPSESAVDELLRIADEHLADLGPDIAKEFDLTYDGLDPVVEWDVLKDISGRKGAIRYVIRKDGSKTTIEQIVKKSNGSDQIVKKEVLKKGPDGISNINDFIKDLYFWLRGTPPV